MTKKVLVIDDEEVIRDVFQLALEDTPYEIHEAASGADGLVQASEVHPDMIFLDLKMPGMDGIETLRRLREIEIDAPVYIVTAFIPDFLDQLAQAAKTNEFGLAQKPLSGEQIRLIVKGILEEGPESEQEIEP